MEEKKYTGISMSASGARGGKDTTWEELEPHMEAERISFADKLKDIANTIFEPIGLDFHDEATKIKYRWFLVELGTDLCRQIDNDIWVKHAIQAVEQNGEKGIFSVICDTRFPNELECLRDAGMLTVFLHSPFQTLINRGAEAKELIKPIERQFDTRLEEFDLVLNSGEYTQDRMAQDILAYLQGTPKEQLETYMPGPYPVQEYTEEMLAAMETSPAAQEIYHANRGITA